MLSQFSNDELKTIGVVTSSKLSKLVVSSSNVQSCFRNINTHTKRIWLTHYYPFLQMRYELRTTVRVSDEWLSVCAICLHTGLNPKGHQAAYALPNLFAAHDNEEPRYKGQRRFANRASRRCGGFLPVVLSGAIHLFKPLSPGAKTATTVSVSPGVKCTSRKTFCPEAGKNFCGLPPDSRFRPWQ
ncbi:hypothetical protein WGU_01356 [Escherichia coli KTE90]|nr:hypothetical protein A1WA_00088 [Escherichia coli KTE91]ELH42221.1 hypothetical protein A13E_00114 [Escherichia coli KTE184]ELJ83565.1 hypothetical protein WGU_01356 [Escherichia coli KTE90]